MEEKSILEKLKTHTEQAYRVLFHTYYPGLVVYADSILKDQVCAEDLVQDFFIDFWYEKRYKEIESGLDRYLYRSVRNRCLNKLRDDKRRRQRMIELVTEEVEEFKFNIEELEEKEELFQAVHKLPEQCRRIFSMCCMEGFTYQETADQLGITINTVRTQMGRALKSLRTSLKGRTFNMILFMAIQYFLDRRNKL